MAAAGCGGTDRAEAAFAPVDGTESAYCDTYRAWQVHELDGGTGDDQPNPAAFRAYWKDYLEFNKASLQQAPAEIRDEWIVSDRAIRTVLTPVLEKYDFDVQRIAKEGTAAEKALGEPTPEAQKAQDAIHAYEDRVCGVATPPAANVAFKADTSSQSYCAALSDFKRGFEKVASSRFDPGVMRSVFTADSFTESLDALEETAPDDIAADQEAVSEWFRSSWSERRGRVRLRHPPHLAGRHARGSSGVHLLPSRRPGSRHPAHRLRGAGLRLNSVRLHGVQHDVMALRKRVTLSPSILTPRPIA